MCALPVKSERRARPSRTDPLTWVLRTPTPLHGMRPHPQIRHGPFFAVSADMRVLQVHISAFQAYEGGNSLMALGRMLRLDDVVDISKSRVHVSRRVLPALSVAGRAAARSPGRQKKSLHSD